MKHRYIATGIIGAVIITVALFMFSGNWLSQNESTLLPEITDYTTQNNVPYLNDSSPYHLLDVYVPEGSGPFPAIIYIHGGGWVEGSRSDFNSTAILYAKRGIAGFSIDYTLATPNSTAWPKNIQDVIAAVQFVRDNAELYNVDAEKLALMGSSAGAHLASLVGTLSGNESFLSTSIGQEPLRNQICLVINYDGVTDFEYIGENWNPSFIYNIVTSAFGNVTYEQNPDLWREASPATYVSGDAPLFVFVHGSDDVIVPIQVAESFNSKLQAAGVETCFIKIDGDHDILTSESWNTQVRYTLDPLIKRVFSIN